MVRHGAVDWPGLGVYNPVYRGARRDFAPLSLEGKRQVASLAADIRSSGVSFRCVVSSPYTRSLQTAAILAMSIGAELEVEPLLHDWLPVKDGLVPVTEALVKQSTTSFEARHSMSPPIESIWESLDDMQLRLGRVVEKYKPRPLLLVCHEALIASAGIPGPIQPASIHFVENNNLGIR